MEEEIWELREAEERAVTNLVTELDISSITARILANRGYNNPAQVRDFLDCSLDKMHDPYAFQDMKEAVKRIKRAVDKGEKIVIYGDYDVDGITSTALLMNYLAEQGGDVDFYIPNRLTEGYGLNKSALRTLAQEETELVITVDCGIKGHEEIGLVNELGLDIIVTDHHTVPPKLPKAAAVINPKRKDSTYPFAELAGVAVAFKLVQALELEQGAAMPTAQDYLGLVTLGVIADIVPLRDENRIIANLGLEQLSNLSKEEPGLFALAEVAGCLDKEVSTGHIGFGMAPRINACGRLGSPELGVELLLSSSYQQADDLAQKLDDLNDRRQQLSQEMQDEAEALIEQLDLDKEWILVLASPNWHSGVIGNVASDLNEKYHRPVVLIAIEEGVGKGSARSISGFNIHDALLAQEEILESFGGHEQAAGLSVREENIALLQESLNQYAHKRLQKSDLLRRRKVDARVDLEEISFALIEELDSLAPFGCANPSPRLMVDGVKISDYKLVGNNEDHLKLTAQDGALRIDGIAFSHREAKTELDIKDNNVSLIFSPEINCWQGRKNLQLNVKGIKVPLSSKIEELFIQDQLEEETREREFFVEVVGGAEKQSRIKELEMGEELNLAVRRDDNSKSVAVLTVDGAELGYLAQEESNLARKLELGVQYQALTANVYQTAEGSFNLHLLLKEETKEEYYSQQSRREDIKAKLKDKSRDQALETLSQELYDSARTQIGEDTWSSLLEGDNILSVINPAQNKDQISLSFAALKAIREEKMSILVYPFKSILEERFPILEQKLIQLGLEVCRGITSLTDSAEINLLSQLRAQECDLLVCTAEFLQTGLIELRELKSSLGLMIIEEVDYFLEPRFCEPLVDIIAKLNHPLLLAVTSAVTKVEIARLLKRFNFDNHKISNYNKSSLELKDRSNVRVKDDYLQELISVEQQTIIYVNQAQKSRRLAQELRDELDCKDKIAFYHEDLTREEQSYLRRKFLAEEVNILTATPSLNEVWGLENIDSVVFYDPCFNSYNFKYLANQAVKSGAGELYLLYKAEEIEENKELLKKSLPNWELLKELYILLSKNKNKAGKITISGQELLSQLNSTLNFKVTKEFLINCLDIFAELDLLQRTKGEGGSIKLLDKPQQKLDLSTSIRYNEYVVLEEVFSYLEELIKQEESELLKSITETYLITLKGEENIELSR